MTDQLKFPTLRRTEQRGSKPRCHLLTHGTREAVAARLTSLCEPYASVSASDKWMPGGFEDLRECQLHRRSSVLDSELCEQLAAWWLPSDQSSGRTPNFDIASTCLVDCRPGILLVEAKAHVEELTRESAGRRLMSSSKEESQVKRDASHKTIGVAIESARVGLDAQTHLKFGIARDVCYQLSNRFAWAWKLADSGIPVVLVYLAFLNADDMATDGVAIKSQDEWRDVVLSHSVGVVPETIWNREIDVNGTTFVALIRSITQPLISYPTN